MGIAQGPRLEPPPQVIHLHQGECRLTADANVVITTMLGSCVAACLRDPQACVGGMNHFLLPELETSDRNASLRYGAYAMELLVNGLLSMGARRERLEAKLFGGGRMADGLTDVGERNALFAEQFLAREGIQLIGGSLRGRHARRIQFWPVLGRARQLALPISPEMVFRAPSVRQGSSSTGSVELF